MRHSYDLGVRSVRVATPCTEADVSAQPIGAARELGMDVSGFLMLCHMAEPEELARQPKLMESYGAHCGYVTDSDGRLTMKDVAARVQAYRDVLDPGTETGIHGYAGVYSSFLRHAENASRHYDVDIRDDLMECGRRRLVGGQKDMIIDVALNLLAERDAASA